MRNRNIIIQRPISARTATQRNSPATTLALTALLLLFALIQVLAPQTASADEAFDDAVSSLSERSFKVKQAAVTTISNSDDARAVGILTALLEGDLAYRKSDKRIVFQNDDR